MTLKEVEAIVNRITANGWMGEYDAFMGVLNRLDTKILMELYSAIPKAIDNSEPQINKGFRDQMMEGIALHCTL